MNTAKPSNTSERPWPVVLLTALGAWLAAVPLAGVIGLLLGDLLVSGIGPYLVGGLLLAGAGVVLRAEGVSLFVEQVAVPMLLLGGVALGFGLYRDLSMGGASFTLAAVALGVAWTLRGAWLQALLGAAACGLVLVGVGAEQLTGAGVWLGAQACVLLWAAVIGRRESAPNAADSPPLEPIGSGWILAALAGLAFSSGMTFLAGAVIDAPGGDSGWHAAGRWWAVWPGLSVVLAVASAAVLWHRQPALRQVWCAGAAVVALVLAWYMPALGAVWLVAALCVTTGRPRLAAAAGVAAVWTIGAFYYQLAWPLATKASVLIGTGVGLGLLAWWGHRVAHRASPPTERAAATVPPGRARLGIALCGVAVLAVVNVAIWQKEDLIAHGQPVYVELAPVDPRSLMQGDYMALNYRLGDTLRGQLDGLDTLERPVAVAEVDARGVARLERLADAATLFGPTTLRMQLTPKDGRWVLVSDAWFFKEGDGARWEAARYGEFRVMPDGRALLVGMADADLKPMR